MPSGGEPGRARHHTSTRNVDGWLGDCDPEGVLFSSNEYVPLKWKGDSVVTCKSCQGEGQEPSLERPLPAEMEEMIDRVKSPIGEAA